MCTLFGTWRIFDLIFFFFIFFFFVGNTFWNGDVFRNVLLKKKLKGNFYSTENMIELSWEKAPFKAP